MAASQRDTLLLFTALCLVRRTWAGSLLVAVRLNDAGKALAFAALAAGAASIFLEDDPVKLREAQREGCCTCTVNSLDEALRIVKNEIRQGRAVAVALRGDPAAWLANMLERGVQPEAFCSTRPLAHDELPAINVLRERGIQTMHGFGLSRIQENSTDLEDFLTQASARWSLHEEQSSTLTERRAQDAALLAATAQEDAIGLVTKRWLQVAPALFPRDLERTYWRANG